MQERLIQEEVVVRPEVLSPSNFSEAIIGYHSGLELEDLQLDCHTDIQAAAQLSTKTSGANEYSGFSKLIKELPGECITKAGEERLKNWLESPTTDLRALTNRSEIIYDLIKNPELRNDLATVIDCFDRLQFIELNAAIEHLSKEIKIARSFLVKEGLFNIKSLDRKSLSPSKYKKLCKAEAKIALLINEIKIRTELFGPMNGDEWGKISSILNDKGELEIKNVSIALRWLKETSSFSDEYYRDNFHWYKIHLKNVTSNLATAAFNIDTQKLSSSSKYYISNLISSIGSFSTINSDPLVIETLSDGTTKPIKLSKAKINEVIEGLDLDDSADKKMAEIESTHGAYVSIKTARQKLVFKSAILLASGYLFGLNLYYQGLGQHAITWTFVLSMFSFLLNMAAHEHEAKIKQDKKGKFFTDNWTELAAGYKNLASKAEHEELQSQVTAAINLDALLVAAEFFSTQDKFCVAEISNENSEIESINMVGPKFSDDSIKYVPNNLSLKVGQGLLVNGSNTGGKSVFQRVTIFNQLTAQTFKIALADKFRTKPFDLIHSFTPDIGQGESKIGGRFEREVARVDELFEESLITGKSFLASLDEWGQSTDARTSRQTFENACTALVGAGGTVIAATQDLSSVNSLVLDGVVLADGTKLIFNGLQTVEENNLPTFKFKTGVATSTNPEPILRMKRFTRNEIELRIQTAQRDQNLL